MGTQIQRTKDIERNFRVEAKTFEADGGDLVTVLIESFDLGTRQTREKSDVTRHDAPMDARR